MMKKLRAMVKHAVHKSANAFETKWNETTTFHQIYVQPLNHVKHKPTNIWIIPLHFDRAGNQTDMQTNNNNKNQHTTDLKW